MRPGLVLARRRLLSSRPSWVFSVSSYLCFCAAQSFRDCPTTSDVKQRLRYAEIKITLGQKSQVDAAVGRAACFFAYISLLGLPWVNKKHQRCSGSRSSIKALEREL